VSVGVGDYTVLSIAQGCSPVLRPEKRLLVLFQSVEVLICWSLVLPRQQFWP
jgi:hypothetical protein